MEIPIAEVETRFDEAASAAVRGERVVVTKNGRPFVEIVPARLVRGFDPERAAQIRRELGLDGLTVSFAPDFDDPAYSRAVLGLDD